jgi:septum formation topological specificity factor MinE
MKIDGDAVDIRMERDDERSSLEINIELPVAGRAGHPGR